MPSPELPIEDLPIWSRLNNVRFGDFEVREFQGRGYGVACRKALSAAEQPLDESSLLRVPHSLVLNEEAVEEYAKEDRNFRQLFDAVGRRVTTCLPCLVPFSSLADHVAVNKSRHPPVSARPGCVGLEE